MSTGSPEASAEAATPTPPAARSAARSRRSPTGFWTPSARPSPRHDDRGLVGHPRRRQDRRRDVVRRRRPRALAAPREGYPPRPRPRPPAPPPPPPAAR